MPSIEEDFLNRSRKKDFSFFENLEDKDIESSEMIIEERNREIYGKQRRK